VGVPSETHPERISWSVEPYLETVRFDQRSKLGELPIDLKESVRLEWDIFHPQIAEAPLYALARLTAVPIVQQNTHLLSLQ